MTIKKDQIKLNASWKAILADEFAKPYMQSIKSFLVEEKAANKVIYPKGTHYFAALNLTPFEDIKVVILGQDPYHGPNQAHGLCFSVLPGVTIPPSLINIFKEINADLSIDLFKYQHGCLVEWAKQGVLLLNSVLTVEKGRAGSHQGKGWEVFTDAIIEKINDGHEHVVFLLWGAYAQKKGQFIDGQRHCVLKAPHPSPLSAHRGFFGCQHFSKANDYLLQHNKPTVDWSSL